MRRPVDLLLARLVVEAGLLDLAQLDAALGRQEAEHPAPPLDLVLVEAGLISLEQMAGLQRAQAHALAAVDPRGVERELAWRLAALALRLGKAGPEPIRRALREQSRREQEGRPWAPLGDLLVEHGTLPRAEVDDMLRGAADGVETVVPGAAPRDDAAAPTVVPAPRPAGPPAGGPLADSTLGATRLPSAAAVPGGAVRAPVSRRFGKYELLQELGRGGMGVVYQAFHPELKTHFAVKVLLAGDDASAEDVQRFHREAQAAARLRHPGIVSVVDIGEQDGKTYFAMEYVEGTSLDKVLQDPLAAGLAAAPGTTPSIVRGRRAFALDAAAAVRMTKEIAEALSAAHAAGVVHRDLKPANVIRDKSGRLKVMDFGLARLVDTVGKSGATRSGTLMGTPAYMSPEQAEGRVRDVDAVSDVYQVGAIFYELLTGRAPYHGDTAMDVVLRVLQDDPPPPRRIDPRIDRNAETICLKAMAREKGRRYAGARELAEDCARWLAGEAVLARPEAAWEKARRWTRKQRAWLGPVALAATLGLVAGLLAWRNAVLTEEVVTGLRRTAKLCLDATLDVRRLGGRMSEARRKYLPPLLEAVKQAEERAPHLAEPHYHLGRMHRALMEIEAAKREQDAALARDPDFAPSLYERSVYWATSFRNRLNRLDSDWRAAEGLRLAVGGDLAKGGGGGRVGKPLPRDEELAAGDAEVRDFAKRLRADLERLGRSASASAANGVTPAMRCCAQALLCLIGPGGTAAKNQARALFLEAMEQDAGLEEAVEGLARQASNLRQYEEAIQVYGRALEADRGYVPYWTGRAAAYAGRGAEEARRGQDPQGSFQAACADYGRALELDPAFVEGWTERGSTRSNWISHVVNRGGDPASIVQEAIADFEQALEIDPAFTRAWVGRGMVRLAWGVVQMRLGVDPGPVFQQAVADSTRALELHPGSADAWLTRGIVRANWGSARSDRGEDPAELFAVALSDFDQALEIDPVRAEAWKHRAALRSNWGLVSQNRGEGSDLHFRDAVADYGKALDLDPTSAEIWKLRAGTRMNWGNQKETQGEDPRPFYREAVADCDRALELETTSAAIRVSRATVRTNWGLFESKRGEDPGPHYEAAVADYRAATALDPGYAEAWQKLGRVRLGWGGYRMGHGEDPGPLFQDAVADLGKALALNPALADAWFDRAQVRSHWGDYRMGQGEDPRPLYQDAIADYGKALELNPSSFQAWTGRGNVRATWGKQRIGGEDPGPFYRDAGADYAQALALNPASAEIWRCRGLLRMFWGRHEASLGKDPGPLHADALADLDRSLELNPGFAESWMNRGTVRMSWAELKTNRREDPAPLLRAAAVDLFRVSQLNPRWAEPHWRYGCLFHTMGRWSDAVAEFEAALALDPTTGRTIDAMLDDARRRADEAGRAAPPWQAAFARAERALLEGRFVDAPPAYEQGMAAFAALPEAERRRLLAAPAAGVALRRAHYQMACLRALASVGKDGPQAAASSVSREDAERLRAAAFDHLREAIGLGWTARDELEKDADLECLHGDARWRGVLEELERARK